MLRAFCLPVKIAFRGYTDAEAQILSISERRRRTSIRVGYVARTIYLGIQLVCIIILLHSDSGLGTSWRSQHASYAWSFLGLMALNFLLYCVLCNSNPGYLPIKDVDPEQAPLNSSAAAKPSGTDTEAVSDTPTHRDGYGPLPYPTNYANYINLSALGRDTTESRASAAPWWDLPNPGGGQLYCPRHTPSLGQHTVSPSQADTHSPKQFPV